MIGKNNSLTINIRGSLINLSVPKVMGIVNITPDSFYQESRALSLKKVYDKVFSMLEQGVDIIDIGGYSSRPFAHVIDLEEELRRVIPIIEQLIIRFPEAIFSIDSFRSKVVEESIQAGVVLVNDISGGAMDKNMLNVVAKYRVPYIAMHMKGTPQTMMKFCDYENIVEETIFYFSRIKCKCNDLGIHDLIIDPGFGFAKNIKQNYELLKNLTSFHVLELPILVGLSRKSMIYKILNTDAKNALNGTTTLNTYALLQGVNILRVHDVKECRETIRLLSMLT